MTRTYAIGDVHGQLDELVAAHARIRADRARTGDADALVVHLGDLVDRGPESAETIEFLLMGLAAGEPWMSILGNHDRMFLRFLDDSAYQDPGLRSDLTWLDHRLGGVETLASYGVDAAVLRDPRRMAEAARARVPLAHREFLEALPLWHETDQVIFVHAGLRPGVPLERQTEQDLTWIRRGFLDVDHDFGRLVVHGHTVVDLPTHTGFRVDIDTDAGHGHALTAIVVEGREVHVLTDAGRVRLPPP